MASWAGDDGEVDATTPPRPGEVKFYFANCLSTDEGTIQHVFCCVQWFNKESLKDKYRRPVEVWKPTYSSPGSATFLPIQRIHCKFAAAFDCIGGSQTIIVTPLMRTYLQNDCKSPFL